jgi:hypothetical protein
VVYCWLRLHPGWGGVLLKSIPGWVVCVGLRQITNILPYFSPSTERRTLQLAADMPVTWIDRELNVELAHVVFLERIEYVTDEDYVILEKMRSRIADSDKWPFDEWPFEEGEKEEE